MPLFYFQILNEPDALERRDEGLPDVQAVLVKAGGEAGILMCGLSKDEGDSQLLRTQAL